MFGHPRFTEAVIGQTFCLWIFPTDLCCVFCFIVEETEALMNECLGHTLGGHGGKAELHAPSSLLGNPTGLQQPSPALQSLDLPLCQDPFS